MVFKQLDLWYNEQNYSLKGKGQIGMTILSVHQLQKYFGERCLFDGVTFDVDAHDRIGFVGDNGCGKTTLFRMLTGEEPADAGQVVAAHGLRIGYMEQHVCRDSRRSLYEEVLTVFDPLIQTEQELANMQHEMTVRTDDALIERYNTVRERFELDGGLYFRGRVASTLKGLGFTDAEQAQSVDTLSGGQRSKAALAKLLLSDSKLLLLDEPTNHLDIPSVEWLEEFLRGFAGAFIVISHDRYFLDRVTTRTIELTNGHLVATNGNYSVHREKRLTDAEIARHHYQSAMRDIEKTRQSIEKLKSFNREKSVRRARSKEKMLDRQLDALEIPETEAEHIRFDFTARTVSGNDVLMADELAMGFDEKTLFEHVNLHIRRGERVFLLGPNGCGKTTLLKILQRRLAPRHGLVRTGEKVSVGYYDQTQAGLDTDKTAIDALWDLYPELTQTEVRSALAAFLFRGDAVFRPVGLLSGGERARLLLLKLMLARDNLLLLDEPTNHLDIGSREALEQALEGYDGTMVVVSHDRYFINRMANKILCLTPTGCTEVVGNYDAYMRQLAAAPVSEPSKKAESEPSAYAKRKEKDAERRKRAARIRKLEADIEQRETAQRDLRAKLELPEVVSDYQQIADISAELEAIDKEILQLMDEWESLTLLEQ